MVKEIKHCGIYYHGYAWNKTLVTLNDYNIAPCSVGGDYFTWHVSSIAYHFFLHTITKSLSMPFPGKRETVSILRNLLFGRGNKGVVHRVAVISTHAALIFKKVCWLSSLPRVMIDYKARPNFQDETRNHLKFTWFHVALQTETWTRFLESLAKVHELL